MVAAMLEALTLEGKECVLEVGTGYGFQTGLIALLARRVFREPRPRSRRAVGVALVRPTRLSADRPINVGDHRRSAGSGS
jgi:Protein-L-isoaspartate(D-aspartate) O-methyltransferase (PCMT)